MTHRRDRACRRKSDPGTLSYRPASERTVVACELPWGASKVVPISQMDFDLPPGIFTAQSILVELFAVFDRKLNAVVDEPIDKHINKSLQRGEDGYMDHLLLTLFGVSEVCLPSVLKALISWFERKEKEILEKINPANENRFRLQKKLLAANYLLCLALIEVLPQAEFHLNSCEGQINYILNLTFRHIAFKDPLTLGVNHTNSLILAETNAEVLGVLSLTHFSQIHRAFFAQLNELKKDATSPTTPHNIISLLMGMKYLKIKTHGVCVFEVGIKFLDELGAFFLEVKEKDVKHAAAGLLVEILVPVASQIKSEVNIPALIAFVTKYYGPTNEMASKKAHKMAAFPLLTCLLCVSQRAFFLQNWVPFLNATLANLRGRDRLPRVAIESLYRLIWVYMIRIGGDGNTSTRSRLESICNSLFPKGNRAVVPRDAPFLIFVKIIHFISLFKLDFAFHEIIFELLGVNRQQRSLYPERMNIGIRALMVIADGLQQKEEPPGMPNSLPPLASGTMARIKKKTYITRPLTGEVAKSIGLEQYYAPCRKAFDNILKILDQQVGKSLMLTAVQSRGGAKPEELTGGEAKPKLDLLRTCVAAIPRLLPDSMSPLELVDILTRISVHIDSELRELAAQTLQNLVTEFADWREIVMTSTLNLIITQLNDTYPHVLDIGLRLLLQLVVTWRTSNVKEKMRQGQLVNSFNEQSNGVADGAADGNIIFPASQQSPLYMANWPACIYQIEGFALVMLCQNGMQLRKIAVQLLKECKLIFETLPTKDYDTPVITVLDDATPYVVRKYIEHVPMSERETWTMDFTTVCEKIGNLESDLDLVNVNRGNEYMQWDTWACALSGYSEHRFLLARCPSAVAAAWPTFFNRFNAVCGYVDPNNPQNESRASLLRSSKSKASPICGEALSQGSCLQLWQKYVLMCCAFVPTSNGAQSTLASRNFSPPPSIDSDVFRSVSSSLRMSSRNVPSSSSSFIFGRALTMLRWENLTDIRDSVVLGVGSLNAHAVETLLDEMASRGVLREAMEKKLETNVRRRKRKDLLRLQILRIIEMAVFRGLLDVAMIDSSGRLNSHIVDFIDAIRQNLEAGEIDRDPEVLSSLRIHLAKLAALVVDAVPPDSRGNLLPEEKKQALFYLFMGWCSRAIVGVTAGGGSHSSADRSASVVGSVKSTVGEVGSFVEQKAMVAMCRLLCCGPIFDAAKAIGEKGYLYGWLEQVVCSHNHIMEGEAEETLASMLELNECSSLMEWLQLQCYSQTPRVGARCFRALLRVFSRRECPCEFVSLFVLCQAMAADRAIADSAVQMLELVRKRFLDGASSTSPLTSSSAPFRAALSSLTSSDDGCLPTEQTALARRLAKAHPQLTITVFSEACSRMEMAQPHARTALLSLLLPWIENVELVDWVAGDEDAREGPRGWGSEEATQLLLNNLFYLTMAQGEEQSRELADLWRAVSLAFPANLPAIINHLYALTLLSMDSLLFYAKSICVMISSACGPRLSSLLLEQLSSTSCEFGGSSSGIRASLERSEIPPFYRWQRDSSFESHKEILDKAEGVVIASDMASSVDRDTSCEGVRDMPMPPYGGFYSPLSRHLPPATQPLQHVSRSQAALLLLCDLIRACIIDWSDATPRLLQASVLHLDSRLLCRHARQTIINLCLLHAEKAALPVVSSLLLTNTMTRSENSSDSDSCCARRESCGESPTQAHFVRATHVEYRQMLLHSNAMFSSSTDLINAIVFCLSEAMDRPLWAHESTSPRAWRLSSASQLACLVRHVAELLLPSMPRLPAVWTSLSMRQALAAGDRHAASRCFQITAALCQPPGPWVSLLLSRLIETAGESQEEAQAYVTDLLLCLLASIPHIAPPQLLEVSGGASNLTSAISPSHTRSTSYTPALLRQSGVSQRVMHDRKEARLSLLMADETPWIGPSSLPRSKSAEALPAADAVADAEEEATNTRAMLTAMTVALLDSAIDNEFLLALQIIAKILETTQGASRAPFLQKLEKSIGQMEWKSYSGIVALVSRGVVIAGAYDDCVSVLLSLTEIISEPVIGGRSSFALIVVAVLPYLLLHFDSPNSLCIKAVKEFRMFAQSSSQKMKEENDECGGEDPLVHLSTMMSQYESRSFTKDRLQWAKCVVKYACAAVEPCLNSLIALLAEILERGQASSHAVALHLLFVLLQERDASCTPLSINAQVVRAVSRHIQGVHWQEASRVLKVLVDQWHHDEDRTQQQDAFELAPSLLSTSSAAAATATRPSPPSPRKAAPSLNADAAAPVAAATLRRPPPAARVRERLAALLGGALPTAASLVFSPSEIGSSAASSSDRICPSCTDVAGGGGASTTSQPDASIGDSFPRVFKEFDFLEAEHDSVSETADSCFGWLSTMRTHSMGGEKELGGRRSRGEDEEEEGEDDDGSVDEESGLEGEREGEGRSKSRASSDRTPCASEVDDVDEDEEEEYVLMDKLSYEMDALSAGRTRSEAMRDVGREEDISIGGSSLGGRSELSVDLEQQSRGGQPQSLPCTPLRAPHPRSGPPPILVQCAHHLNAHVETAWSAVLSDLAEERDSGDLTVHATLLLTQLYKLCCSGACCLLRDASLALSSPRLSRVFARAHDELMRVADCPFLFVSSSLLRGSPVQQRLKHFLFLQQGHFETFAERREKCIRALNAVKSAQKLSAIGGSPASLGMSAELTLAKSLQKLFFQLMLMRDALSDMVRTVRESPNAHELSLSPAVLLLQRDLLLASAADGLPPPQLPFAAPPEVSSAVSMSAAASVAGDPAPGSAAAASSSGLANTATTCSSVASTGAGPATSSLSMASVQSFHADSLLLLIANKQHGAAIATLRHLRLQSLGGEFGCCEHADVDVLLLLFCRSQSLRAWALVGADENALKEHCDVLREANAELAAAVRKAATEGLSGSLAGPLSGSLGGPPQGTGRTATLSSLADSSTSSSYVKSVTAFNLDT